VDLAEGFVGPLVVVAMTEAVEGALLAREIDLGRRNAATFSRPRQAMPAKDLADGARGGHLDLRVVLDEEGAQLARTEERVALGAPTRAPARSGSMAVGLE
jgi:hypothetical protein